MFSTEALKLSIRRINQLGYAPGGPPQINPSPLGEDKLDVAFKVQEQNRNQFTFGGGVSGLEGTFLNASFSTANFLGLGETFQVSAQSGKRTKNYQIAVTEPYLFDRPITAGFDVFSRRIRYEASAALNLNGYSEDRSGASLVLGLPLGRFTRLFTNYSYQFIDIKNVEAATTTTGTPDPTPHRRPPSTRSTARWANGGRAFRPPGSTTRWTTLVAPAASAHGHHARHRWCSGRDGRPAEAQPGGRGTSAPAAALGLRGEVAYIKPFGDTKTGVLPRYFLGRDPDPRLPHKDRGPHREAGGRTERGRAATNTLIQRRVLHRRLGALAAAGLLRCWPELPGRRQIGVSKLRTSTGLELRFIMPVLNVPFEYRLEPQPRPLSAADPLGCRWPTF